MYIKIFICLSFMISTIAIGVMKAEELNKRVQCLLELKRLMILLQGEFRVHRGTLSEAFVYTAGRVEEPFSGFLKETAKGLDDRSFGSFSDVWEKVTEQLVARGKFFKNDQYLLDQLGRGLGYLDLTMQMENINLAICQTEEAIKSAKEEKNSKGKLYRTMGVTAGAFLSLLII